MSEFGTIELPVTKAYRTKYWDSVLGVSLTVRRSAKYRREHKKQYRQKLKPYVMFDGQLSKRFCRIRTGYCHFVYRLSACGVDYIGQTNDPHRRLYEHLIESENSAL